MIDGSGGKKIEKRKSNLAFEDAAAEGLISDIQDVLGVLADGISIWSSDRRLLHCNPRFAELILASANISGLKNLPAETIAEQIIVDQGPETTPASGCPTVGELFVEAVTTPLEPVTITGNGGRLLNLTSRRLESGRMVLTIREMADHGDAEQQAREMLHDAIDTVDVGIALVDDDERLVFANQKFREIGDPNNNVLRAGRAMRSIHGDAVDTGLFPLPPDLDREGLLDHLDGLIRDCARQFPVPNNHGSEILGSIYQTPLGGRLLTLEDVTDRKRIEDELEQQREIAHQNEKLSALGALLAGVAHELNNPLSVIIGYAQMLQGRIDDPVSAERVEQIAKAAGRCAKIVKTFLAMARQQPARVELCSLNAAARTALEVTTYGLRSNGTKVEVDLDDTIPLVTGDADQLAQVFSNLIVNAEQALKPRGTDGLLIVRSRYDKATDHCVVEIKDNGPGIPTEVQARVFEPFFTTKDAGQGTGIGLAFSYRIVKSHGGKLELGSTGKLGSCFVVKLRAAKDYDLIPIQDDDSSAVGMARQNILVVDDEPEVARLLDDILTEAGMQVTRVTTAKDALDQIGRHAFDAVLSDFRMPEMDGEAFHAALTIIAPQLVSKLGYVTGNSLSASVRQFLRQSGRPHIEKPLVAADLVAFAKSLTGTSEGASP